MRNNFVLGLAAIALGFGLGGAGAAPIESNLQASALQASTADNLQPPQGMQLNQKGLAAIKPAGSQSGASDLASDLAANLPSNIAKMGTSNMVLPPDSMENLPSNSAKTGTSNMVLSPDSMENLLSNNLLSGSTTAANENMVRPPVK